MHGPTVTPESLSASQLAFAHEMGAEPRLRSQTAESAVFLYRETAAGVDRWLVDRFGEVIEHEHFANRGT